MRRLNSDGSVDYSFPWLYLSRSEGVHLNTMPDGGIFVAGRNLLRLLANGQGDTNFVTSSVGGISCSAFQADGKIVIGGSFTTVGGQPRSHVARLHADGTLDLSFNPPGFFAGDGASVTALAIQSDGRVLVGGHFETVGSLRYEGLVRLNPDGTLDTTSTTRLGLLGEDGESSVSAILVQSADKALVAGWFDD